jgi:CheY-like chemotaxis protein
MNTTQDTIKLALVQAELAAGLICINDQMSRLDRVIALGGVGASERRDLWRMETDQASLTNRETIIMGRIARDARPSVVLVVEDDLLVLMSAVADLQAAGFIVLEASNADEALALLETRDSIGAVFTDVQMPGTMDGLALARVVHTRWPLIKMIITSGNTHFGIDDLTLGDQFLRKPYRAEDVTTALRTN